jgi:RNA polymerase sigma factor (sigma-70 family)
MIVMLIRQEADDTLVKRLLPSVNPSSQDRACAWQEWWDEYRGAVLDYIRYLRYTNGVSADDEEILQDAIMTAYVQVERGQYEHRDGIPFTAYVKRIARNKILEAYRRDKRSVPLDLANDLPADDEPEREAERQEAHETLHRRLRTLPPRRSTVLRLVMEGREVPEIAHSLGIREDLVRKEKSRALQELRRSMSVAG